MTGESWFVVALLGGFAAALEVLLVPATVLVWWQRHAEGWGNVWWVVLLHAVVLGTAASGVAVHLQATGLR